MVEIKAHICPHCKDIIYSRALHDCMYCSCGHCFVDGGSFILGDTNPNGYLRVAGNPIPTTVKLSDFDSVEEAKEALYDDWNDRINNYGRIVC